MSTDSPFLLFKVECPICKTINEFEQIKVGAYTEEGRDTDFCPQGTSWRNPKYQASNPLLYFTATCSNCYYTQEFTNSFREWKSDNAFRTYRLKTLKTKHLEQLSTADSLVKGFGDALDIQRFPNESAIIKLHLAIYDAQLVEHPSNLDLARFYLRIGWVFRGLATGEDPAQLVLRGLLRDVDQRYLALQESIETASGNMDSLKSSLAAHFETDQVRAETQSLMFSFRDRYDAEINGLSQTFQSAGEAMSTLRTLMDEYRTAILGGEQGGGEALFGSDGSFTDFLRRQQSRWDGVVTCEREALEKAIKYYKAAYAGGRDIAPGAQQIQASYLIAELSRRIGDYDGAKQFFTSTIKSGQEFIYQNRRDRSRTVLTRKILELAIEQGRANLTASKPA